MFTSLMLDTLRQRVDSATELKKANWAGQQLLAVLKAIPSFKDMARNRLVEKLREYHPGVELDKVFVNRGSYAANLESRPAGSLLEVHFECLSRNLSPSYVIGSDGVYNRANTTDSQFKVPGLDIYQVERLLENARQNLSWKHRNSLDQYWKAAANEQIDGKPSSTHKDVLQQSIAETLMAELSLSVIGGRLESHQGERLADLLLSGHGGSLYQVVINNVGEFPVRLPSGFVVDMSGLGNSELTLDNEHYTYVLYTSDRGFEFFLSSNDVHAALSRRLSISGSSITYPGLQESVFQYCVSSWVKHQKDEVSKLLEKNDYNVAGLFASLESNQQFGALRHHWRVSFEALQAAIKRTEWPNWLKVAPPSVQERHSELEYSMVKYESDFNATFNGYFSLREYARRQVAHWTRSALGIELDSESIRVRSVYEFKVGGRTIRQEDSYTLTEFVTVGLHDSGRRARLVLEGGEAFGLTIAKLESWLQNIDVRANFVTAQPSNPPQPYREALNNKIFSQMEFALWVAHHSGRFSSEDFNLVNRALAGDSAVLINGVSFEDSTQPLKDVLVFHGRQGALGPQQVFLRNPQGHYEFLRFGSFSECADQFKLWMSGDPVYAASLINPNDLPAIGKKLAQASGLRWERDRIRVAAVVMNRSPNEPLAGLVQVDYRWTFAEINGVAPLNYRRVTQSLRQTYARLNTELKALYTVEFRDTGFPSVELFARNLIKQRVEQVLRERGSAVDVDPDLVYVQISPQENMTLSQLIISERSFEANNSPKPDPRDYPRFYWSTAHPPLDNLSIRDISGWSKTLRAGEKYIELLKSDYLSSSHPLYAFKREVNFKKLQGEMHQALRAQYFDAGLNVEQLNSLERIIVGLGTPEGYRHSEPVVNTESVYYFTLKSTRKVEGVYIFRAVTSKGVEDFIYTPHAPDHVAFRSVNSFVGAIRDRAGPFREYYIKRISFLDKKVINDYFDELQEKLDQVAPPKPLINTRVRDLGMSYGIHIRRVIEDVDAQTTSLAEIIGGLVYENLKLAATVISIVIPPVGLAVTAIEVAKNIYDGIKAQYYGDSETAFTHFKDALIGLVGLAKVGQGVESVTKAQKTLIQLVGDANTVVGLMSTALGQKLGHERLLEIVQQVLDEPDASTSKTTVI
ncbi:dermonecrotic toxin domain-containing protein [Pseudomonas fluorescens]|nr:DUF6543 domain-containing protein [Pseudomonas fluorescens]